ncbi:MAG: trypsin-like peptidase domain-containing protein [Bacilli bacterium]
MKNKINYILVIVLSIMVGAGATYTIINRYPNTVTETVNRNNVTLTDKGIAEGVSNIVDSVVVVESINSGKVIGTGTGFAYKKEKGSILIMTNHHVIADSKEIKLILSDKREVTAELVGSDEYADIAVLKVKDGEIKKIAVLSTAEGARVGDTVFTIGTPIDTNFAGTVTRGILSGKNRLVSVSVQNSYSEDWIMNVMQTDAAINPGNSGGPLCNVNGEVIGINSLKIVESSIEGIGFAIPIEDALDYANTITSGKKIIRPYIGIEMVDVNQTYALMSHDIKLNPSITKGIVVVVSEKDGPAYKANLRKGDVIVKLNEHDTGNVAQLRYNLYKYKPGDTIKVKYIRDGKENETSIKLTQK